MVQEIRQCIIILKNLEASIDMLLSKCSEVKQTHEEDKMVIANLLKEIEQLKNELSSIKSDTKE